MSLTLSLRSTGWDKDCRCWRGGWPRLHRPYSPWPRRGCHGRSWPACGPGRTLPPYSRQHCSYALYARPLRPGRFADGSDAKNKNSRSRNAAAERGVGWETSLYPSLALVTVIADRRLAGRLGVGERFLFSHPQALPKRKVLWSRRPIRRGSCPTHFPTHHPRSSRPSPVGAAKRSILRGGSHWASDRSHTIRGEKASAHEGTIACKWYTSLRS